MPLKGCGKTKTGTTLGTVIKIRAQIKKLPALWTQEQRRASYNSFCPECLCVRPSIHPSTQLMAIISATKRRKSTTITGQSNNHLWIEVFAKWKDETGPNANGLNVKRDDLVSQDIVLCSHTYLHLWTRVWKECMVWLKSTVVVVVDGSSTCSN